MADTPLITQGGGVQIATPVDPTTPLITQSGSVQGQFQLIPWPRIRSGQIGLRAVAPDRLVNTPIDVLASNKSFDLTQTRVFNLYFTPTNKLGFVLGIFVKATLATGVTVVPQISVGVTTGETDIFPTESLTNFDTLNDVWSNWLVTTKAINSAPGSIVKINVTGATATALFADIYLIGFEA